MASPTIQPIRWHFRWTKLCQYLLLSTVYLISLIFSVSIAAIDDKISLYFKTNPAYWWVNKCLSKSIKSLSHSRKFKEGGIGSLFHPCVNSMERPPYLPVMYGGELLYLRIWRNNSARSAHIIITLWFTVWFSPCWKGNSHLLGGLINEKIRRYNNCAPYVTFRWLPIPP